MMVKSTAAGMPGAEKIEGDEGDGVSQVTEALIGLAKARNFDDATLVDDILRAMLEQFRNRPKDWQQMSADEQSDVVAALTESATEFVGKALKLFAADDRPHVNAKVMNISADGSKTKMVLEVKDETAEDVADIYRVLRKDVVVILADSNDYMSRGGDSDLVQPDQNAMDFDAEGNDEDLAGD